VFAVHLCPEQSPAVEVESDIFVIFSPPKIREKAENQSKPKSEIECDQLVAPEGFFFGRALRRHNSFFPLPPSARRDCSSLQRVRGLTPQRRESGKPDPT
jgi:hypothetical protein